MGYAEILIRQMGITDEMIHKYREKFTHDGLGACLKALARRGWLAAEPVYTCIVQHTRETQEGRELWGRYWSSISVVRAVAITDEDHINKDVPDRLYKYGVY